MFLVCKLTDYDTDPQKVQTVQSWLAEATTSFVDAKLADHVLALAQATVKTAVCKNLEEPDKHFQNYGDTLKSSHSLSSPYWC